MSKYEREQLECNEGSTYIDRLRRREPYILAVFDDWSTVAMQIHKTILALMHTHLTTPNDQDTVLDACDMRGATGSAADQEACGHRVDG